MLALVLGTLLTAAPLSPDTLEPQAAHHVVEEFERVGRRAPTPDALLGQAARQIPREDLEDRD